ncbi:unnamed protein product [Diatraea saccharalis]|uniref:Kinase n=1 Tax=Diatraea saccharalis TaxID=40085 RepID=A0A9N9R2V2_9NEOP|nr:unnamed protein product [Diatraea saccharalis]
MKKAEKGNKDNHYLTSIENLNKEKEINTNDIRKKQKKFNKRKDRSFLKRSGKRYITMKGKVVNARSLKENPCKPNGKCPNECYSISEERRKTIFDHYWSLSVERQRDWIVSHIKKETVKRKRTKDIERRRQFTYRYCINDGEGQRPVCMNFFMNTLDVRQRNVHLLVSNSEYGSSKSDKRPAEYQQIKLLRLLQCNNGTILKPILKPSQEREVAFYSRLQSARHPELAELRSFVPRYFGRTTYAYNHHQLDYIVLEDLTQGMLEQCVMDVKIGKRTWDPLATEEKIKSEQTKYALCKQEFGFCIPGYQVYELATGRLLKYGKEHGKKLHGHMVKDAIRKYLNSFGSSLCRALLLQLLAGLWRIQKWARAQTSVRLYCTSLLLLYDAAKLRDCCAHAHLTQYVTLPLILLLHLAAAALRRGQAAGLLRARTPDAVRYTTPYITTAPRCCCSTTRPSCGTAARTHT